MTQPHHSGAGSRLPADSDYTQFEPGVTAWQSLEDFATATTWQPGVHIVTLPSGDHVDILLSGDVLGLAEGRALPVVFSGAVGPREGTRPPYFSGMGLGRRLGTPLVSLSDPLLATHDRLKLGWYAGAAGEDLQGHIGAILRVLSRRVGRELLLAGGSGGGFASLFQALRLDVPVSALAWNPQTDLLDYDPGAVDEFLVAALGRTDDDVASMSRAESSAALRSVGIEHQVLPEVASTGLRRVLYVQNASDWHVARHLAPFLSGGGFTHAGGGRWTDANGSMVLVSSLADGHSVLPPSVLEHCVGALLDVRAPVSRVVDGLQSEGLIPSTDLETLPRDLRAEVDDLATELTLVASVDPAGSVDASVVWDDHPTRYAGMSTVFELLDDAGTVLAQQSHADNRVRMPPPGTEPAAVRVQVRDGFLNPLVTLTEKVTRVPQAIRVLIVGSCVSRDTFEFLNPDVFTLAGYVARQSLISAFGRAGEPHFDVSVLPSAFQRRMLEGDARSSLPGLVGELADGVDLVLWDLVDERLGILDHVNGGTSTDSVELRHAQSLGQATAGPTGPAFGSPEHLARFTAALAPWRALLAHHDLLSRTLLLAPPWAEKTDEGEATPSSFGLEAAQANELTEAYLRAASRELAIPVLGQGLDHVVSRAGHQWGVAPFHYDDATYLTLAGEIARAAHARCTPWGWEELATPDLTRVPPRAGRDPRTREASPWVEVEQTGPLQLTASIHGVEPRPCSFSLFDGAQRIEATPYVRTATHQFSVPKPGIYRCRVFVLNDEGERVPVASPPLRVT